MKPSRQEVKMYSNDVFDTNKLNKFISQLTQEGWTVVQIMPSEGTRIPLICYLLCNRYDEVL